MWRRETGPSEAGSRQADGDLGHVPMLLCPVSLVREIIRHADREQTMLIIRAKALVASVPREESKIYLIPF